MSLLTLFSLSTGRVQWMDGWIKKGGPTPGGCMDGLSVGSSTPAREPQDGPNVHHGLSLMSQ
jgi:hypothetical protein